MPLHVRALDGSRSAKLEWVGSSWTRRTLRCRGSLGHRGWPGAQWRRRLFALPTVRWDQCAPGLQFVVSTAAVPVALDPFLAGR